MLVCFTYVNAGAGAECGNALSSPTWFLCALRAGLCSAIAGSFHAQFARLAIEGNKLLVARYSSATAGVLYAHFAGAIAVEAIYRCLYCWRY